MDVKTECNTNRARPSGFYRKPVRSMDWSLASKKSIFSLHTGNVSLSRKVTGLAAALKFDEIQKLNKLDSKITETNPVISLLPPDKESLDNVESDDNDNENEEIININWEELEVSDATDEQEEQEEVEPDDDFVKETKPDDLIEPVEENFPLPVKESRQDSDSESDVEDKMAKEVEDDRKEIKPEDSNEPVNQETETNLVSLLPLVKESEDTEKSDLESDDEDVKEMTTDNSSICRHSDRSNNSISSFSFPILDNEDGSIETSCDVFDKWWKLPQEKMQRQTQARCYVISATHTLTHLPSPPRNFLKKQYSQMRSGKALKNFCFSCFYGPVQHD